jgi:kynurenine formamidase
MKLFTRFLCMVSWSAAVLVLCQSVFAQGQRDKRTIDLSHTFDETTIYWPTEDGFRLLRGPAGVTEQGYYYAANRFMCAEHGGTHIDAPIHFWKGGQTVDQISLARLVGAAACVDVAHKCRGRELSIA